MTDSTALSVGDRAPEFALAGSDGQTHRLSDLHGRVVVLAWFPKAFFTKYWILCTFESLKFMIPWFFTKE